MKEFIYAALPWVLIGFAIIVFTVNYNYEQEKGREAQKDGMAVGMSIGMLVGVALNTMGIFENHAFGICIGMLGGMVLGMNKGKRVN